jgi:hypothetical protein
MRKITLVYFLLFIFGFLYMALHSIVGLDEVMLLDPCRNFLHGNYTSRLWYASGTENNFMAYLPATSYLRLFFLMFLPDSILFHRLPFIFVFFLSAWLIYKITKARFHDNYIILLTVLFFINDKGLWDAALSGRSEILQILFILLYFFLDLKSVSVFISIMKGLVIGCLFLTHPPAWIIVVVLLLSLYRKGIARNLVLSVVAFALPVFIFLLLINFNIRDLFSQLFMDGQLASATHGFFYRLTHFHSRFLPYPYLSQPWVIILFAGCLVYIFNLRIFKEKYVVKISIVFITYLAFLIFFTDNYYRYNPPLLVCMYLLLPFMMKLLLEKYNLKITKATAIIIVIVISLPFAARCIKTYRLRNMNDSGILVNQFAPAMNTDAHSGRALVIGEPVGYYLALAMHETDYSTIYTTHKFNFKNYRSIYYLTYHDLSEPNYKLIKEFTPPEIEDGTYKGLKVYELVEDSH